MVILNPALGEDCGGFVCGSRSGIRERDESLRRERNQLRDLGKELRDRNPRKFYPNLTTRLTTI